MQGDRDYTVTTQKSLRRISVHIKGTKTLTESSAVRIFCDARGPVYSRSSMPVSLVAIESISSLINLKIRSID